MLFLCVTADSIFFYFLVFTAFLWRSYNTDLKVIRDLKLQDA